MSKVTKSDPIEESQTDDLQALINKVDEKAKEFKKKKKEANPEGRLSWNQLFQMFQLIEGLDPRGQQSRPNPNAIINRDFKECGLLTAKLKTNATEARERFIVLNGVLPTFDDEEKLEKYNEKRTALLEEYFGNVNLAGYSEHELIALAGGKEKLDQFNGEMEQLEKDYPEITDVFEAQKEFKNKPLAKCTFDLIAKEETRGAPITPNELRLLDPMLDF